MILGCSFVGLRDAAWLLRAVDGSSMRLRRRSRCRGSPPGGAPFARGESYKRLESQAPRPKASLPKASQASQTRSNTQWARGPANFHGQGPRRPQSLEFSDLQRPRRRPRQRLRPRLLRLSHNFVASTTIAAAQRRLEMYPPNEITIFLIVPLFFF